MTGNVGGMRRGVPAAGVAAVVFIAISTLLRAAAADAGDLMRGVRYGQSRSCFAVSLGIGTSGSTTEMAIDEYPDTKFKGSQVLAGSARFIRVKKGEDSNSGFGVELTIDRNAFELVEQGVSLGRVRNTFVMITPGMQIWSSEYSGAGVFFGILGLGHRTTSFEKGPGITELEAQTGSRVSVEVQGGTFGTILPARVDLPVASHVTLGAAFSGIMVGNAGTSWKIDGVEVSDLSKKMYLSHWQLMGTIGLLF